MGNDGPTAQEFEKESKDHRFIMQAVKELWNPDDLPDAKLIIKIAEKEKDKSNHDTEYGIDAALEYQGHDPMRKVDIMVRASNIHEEVKPKIENVGLGVPIIDFATEVSERSKLYNDRIYYAPNRQQVIEVLDDHDAIKDKPLVYIKDIEPGRLVSVFEERKIRFHTFVKSNDGPIPKDKSPSRENMVMLTASSIFRNSLFRISRVFTHPYIYQKNGNMAVTKEGYCQDLDGYCTSPIKLEEMKPAEAIKHINKLLDGFNFKTPEDKSMAIAFLITPACRGIYKNHTDRTPLFLIMANRARVGKDYLAGLRTITYTGQRHEDPPISSGDRGQNNEELRKYITSTFLGGGRLYHSSNNKGYLNNAVLEQVLTNPIWSDRVLGGNQKTNFDNEMEFSLSANTGLTFTGDLFERCRRIDLFFAGEFPNKRVFPMPDLEGYARDNRAVTLSSIYSLIKTWHEAGQPSDSVSASFKEWARVVGGIMNYHKLGDPCKDQETDDIGGDRLEAGMKDLFEFIYDKQEKEGRTALTMSDIMGIVETTADLIVFPWLKLEEKSGKTAFSLETMKFVGRELSGIKMQQYGEAKRAARRKYRFLKKEDEDKESQATIPEVVEEEIKETPEEMVTNQIAWHEESCNGKPASIQFIQGELKGKVSHEDIDKILASLKPKGDVFSPKSGYWKVRKQ